MISLPKKNERIYKKVKKIIPKDKLLSNLKYKVNRIVLKNHYRKDHP